MYVDSRLYRGLGGCIVQVIVQIISRINLSLGLREAIVELNILYRHLGIQRQLQAMMNTSELYNNLDRNTILYAHSYVGTCIANGDKGGVH